MIQMLPWFAESYQERQHSDVNWRCVFIVIVVFIINLVFLFLTLNMWITC